MYSLASKLGDSDDRRRDQWASVSHVGTGRSGVEEEGVGEGWGGVRWYLCDEVVLLLLLLLVHGVKASVFSRPSFDSA